MSALPNADRAIVAREKLVGYLLLVGHPVGGPKAKFLERFGFTLQNWTELQTALLQHARNNDVSVSRIAPQGRYFEINGELSTPDGRNPTIRSVWLIDPEASVPRLITIVPSRGRTRVAGT
jgi:hypothetical protein